MTHHPHNPRPSSRPAGERLLIGCMTGTSLDALDACAVRATGHALEMRAEVVSWVTRPLGELAPRLRALAEGRPHTAHEISQLALDFGTFHAAAVAALIDELGTPHNAPDLVALHGQTVFHAPPLSWQMINPWPVHERLRCPVVSDLRGADLARGGQGAPITPIADWIMFRDQRESRAVVNLGGFCNITLLPCAPDFNSPNSVPPKSASAPTSVLHSATGHERVSGRDVCACNHLLDAAARAALGLDFDPSGENAAKSPPNPAASDELAQLLTAQSGARRSLGTGDEAVAWVHRWHARLGASELLASCCTGIATVIAQALRSSDAAAPARVILSGGGALNNTLARAIAHELGPATIVTRSDTLGVPVGMREAAQMAVLGALSLDAVPITIPQVTGVPAPAPIAGQWIGLTHAAEPRATEVGPPTSVPQTTKPSAPPDRSRVLSEQRNPNTANLDERSTLEIVRALNAEDRQVPEVVASAAPSIAAFITAVEERMARFGPFGASGACRAPASARVGDPCHQNPSHAPRARLIYIGAGTSGRLGVLDASECPPTFHVDPGMVVGLIAGGDTALRRSSEGREDEPHGVREDFDRLNLNHADAVLGIAAGGTTPYVLGGLALARERGALTALLSCSPLLNGPGSSGADHEIIVPTGPEALTGSTRLKAGTATKLILNTITTTLMVRLGKVHGNLMVDLRATNDKLRDRAARILSALTGLERADALAALDQAGGSVKVAAVMCLRGVPKSDAEELLRTHHGRLRAALGPAHQADPR